jgi:hypothetical protein
MKKFLIVGLIGLTLGLTSFFVKGSFSNDLHSPGLAKTFDSVDEIKSDAALVVRAHIPNNHSLIEVTGKKALYEVKIKEVIKNDTGLDISKNQVISFTQIVSYTNSETGKVTELLSDKDVNLKSGEYLLFLNDYELDNQTYFTSNSPHYLYQWKGNKTFENIRSDNLNHLELGDVAQ